MRKFCTLIAAALLATAALAQPAAAPGPYQEPVPLPHFQDPAINESSGIAASRRSPGILWTHNDSGDEPHLYAVDREGNTVAVYRVRSATAVDWEDMAYGPGPDGKGHSLYIGDIGDNGRTRRDCVVHRIREPKIPPRTEINKVPPQPTDPPTVRRPFVYPDGPRDAEALLVHPKTGSVYIVTKEPSGRAGVYKFPPEPKSAGRRVTLIKLGTVTISGENHPFPNMVTGGDISPDGRRVVLSTYAAAYEFTLPAGARNFDAIWRTRPVRIQTPPLPQGEAICYAPDGKSLILTSEQTPAMVYRLDAVR